MIQTCYNITAGESALKHVGGVINVNADMFYFSLGLTVLLFTWAMLIFYRKTNIRVTIELQKTSQVHKRVSDFDSFYLQFST